MRDKVLRTSAGIGFLVILLSSIFLRDKAINPTVIPNAVIFLIAIILVLLFRNKKGFLTEDGLLCRIRIEFIFILLFACQVFLCLNISFRTSWDPQALLYSAYYAATGDESGLRDMASYLSIYPNNLFIVWVYSLFFSFNEKFKVTGDTLNLLQFFQCAISTISAVLTYKCAKFFTDKEVAARRILFFYILITGITDWLVIPYSDSTGLFFPILLLYMALKIEKGELTTLRKYFLIFIYGFVFYIAYRIKPETVIVAIACVIISFFETKFSENVKRAFFMALGVIVGVLFVNAAINSMGYELDPEAELGWQHFLMQGLNTASDGGNSDSDLEFSKSITSKTERDQINLQVASERLHEMGATGWLKFACVKIYRAFSNGTFGWGGIGKNFYHETYHPRFGRISTIMRKIFWEKEAIEDGRSAYFIYALIKQFLWDLMLVMCFVKCFDKRRLSRNERILFLTMIGIFVYFVLLESHPRYLLVLSPFFYLMSFAEKEAQ